ncbi:MAG TPA: serine/threonine protein phosphatase [Saprospirales bacterium]|nr:serine/threonine protein phosphatase [Saprospirales bacterium]HAY70947.1 serine/threonine protein phosphatase [Saprospirales bacterium]HRQ29223.1 PP2C family protein-serine/threonine phosphatase [Saprospiraceae bacterium]
MKKDLDRLEELERDLNLKQLQIKSLLTITQAINENISADSLFNMYKSFLSWEMGVEKMLLFIWNDSNWECVSRISDGDIMDEDKLDELLGQFSRLHTIKETDPIEIQLFDIVIPVFHKQMPLAYALIGGIKEKDDLYNKIQFITTITNIVAVAIENKRLFKRQLEQERYEKEYNLAREVQQMLIPESLPVTEKYELGSIYMPHSNVGGDYIDFIQFDDKRFVLCIADISGKGIAAAILMANFQAIIQSLIYQYRDLETFIFALNETVYKRITKSDKYITFFIAEVNVDKYTLKYINAGHFPPILYNKGEIIRLDKGCTVIGAFEKMPFIEEETIQLEKESLILTFTDGLTELQNETGDYLQDDGLEAFIQDNKQLSVNQFNQKLLKKIDRFRGNRGYADDIAILTCKIH